MKTRLFLLALCAAASSAQAQVPANGSFETGDLTSWTTGGYTRAGAIRSTHITPTTSLTINDGVWAAAVSTGPGERATGTTGATNFDNLGGNNDYDLSWLQSSFTLPANAAYVAFDWGFASGEQNEPDQYDDLLDVTVNGTRIMTRSSCKLNGSSYSPFPNANCQNATVVDHTVNNNATAVLRTINLRFGSPAFQRICLPLPAGLVVGSTVALRFTVADQNDHQVDSTLFIDDVQIKSSCNEIGSIVQLTNTSGRAVEVKGGGFFVRPAQARALATDAAGKTVAFISSADHGGNASLLDQVYFWNGLTFTRAAWTTSPSTPQMASGGQMQNIALSANLAGTLYGRYAAFSARLTEADNFEIYLYDRSTSTLTALTTTSGCSNTDPSLDGDGDVIAWVSDCNALTAAGTKRRIVVRSGTTNTIVPANTMCSADAEARGVRLTKHLNGRFLVFESNCQPIAAGNADLNYEIFRYDRNTAANLATSYQQVTTTTTNTAGQITQNSGAVLDGSDTGRYVFFISNGNLTPSGTVFNSDFSYEVFRHDSTAVVGSRLSQRTNGSDSDYFGVDVSIDGIDYAFERLERNTFNTSVGHRRVATAGADAETLLASGSLVTMPRIGEDGVVPVISFLSPENFLNTNADGNPEVWQGRVQ